MARPLALLAVLLSLPAAAATYPPKPPPEHFYVDQAGMLSKEGAAEVDRVCFALWKSDRVPIYVVTIGSMADFGFSGPIESYAYELFNAWGIGSQERNNGMLLLVSKGDRKARIELGADWGRGHDQDAKRLMDEQITARFKEGRFSEGIVAGVSGMSSMARGLGLPSPYYPRHVVILWAAGGVLLIGVGISLVQKGEKGWGFALILAGVAVLLFLLKALAESAAHSSSSSGGFGGGSSGGGGASGSW